MGAAASWLVETVLVLGLVCALAWGTLFFARRAGLVRASGPLELLGSLPLEPRRAVHLVKVGETVFVVGACEAGLTKLGELDAEHVPVVAAPRRPFGEVLARLTSRGGLGAVPAKPTDGVADGPEGAAEP